MSENQNYELSFHLNPNLEESKLLQIRQSIEEITTSKNGTISYSKEPEKIRLSYPIKHHANSFFGYIQFNLPSPEVLDSLNEQLKLRPEVLRHLIIKLPSDLQKKAAVLKQVKSRERAEKRTKTITPKPENKELDKKLEDILENL